MSQLPASTTATAAVSSANTNTTSGLSPLSDQSLNCPNLVQSIQTHQTKRLMTPNVATTKLPEVGTHLKIPRRQTPSTSESWRTRWSCSIARSRQRRIWRSDPRKWPSTPWSTLQKLPRPTCLCPSRIHKSILHPRPSRPVFWIFHRAVAPEVVILTAHGMMTWLSSESTLMTWIATALWAIWRQSVCSSRMTRFMSIRRQIPPPMLPTCKGKVTLLRCRRQY